MKNFLVCVFLSYFAFIVNGNFPHVTVEEGVLRGNIKTSFNKRTFYSFTGIPYAKPPIDLYRFEPPQPFGKWTGIYNATKSHPRCVQFTIPWSPIGYEDGEDCLYLNVYTPQLSQPDKELLPVLFYIHGGAFSTGTANYDTVGPQILMDKDVVLVTANYRLGVLGFLSSGDEIVPGNMGLKDQALALKWVARNIQHFGGDPKNITVFGHSVGGTSAHLHMFSNLTKGLFHRVIAQSGTAFSRWAIFPQKDVKLHFTTFADTLMCKKETIKDTINCFKMVSVTIFVRAFQLFDAKLRSHMFYFGPVVEPNIPGAFLSNHPLIILKSGQAANVPLMTGISSEDGGMIVANVFNKIPPIEKREEYFQQKLPLVFWYSNDQNLINITNQIKARYLEDNLTMDKLIKMCTHGLFLDGAYDTILAHSKYSNQVYFYFFEYQSSATYATSYNIDYDFGVTHGDDLLHLFKNTAEFPNYIPTEYDSKVMNLLTTLWTNFAKYSNPTPVEDQQLSVHWQPVESNRTYCYHFKNDTTTECKECLFKNETQFWAHLNKYITI